MEDKLVAQTPRNTLKRLVAEAAKEEHPGQNRRRAGILPDDTGRQQDFGRIRYGSKIAVPTSRR